MSRPIILGQVNSRGYRENSEGDTLEWKPHNSGWTEKARKLQAWLQKNAGRNVRLVEIAEALGMKQSQVRDGMISLTRLDPRVAMDEDTKYYYLEEE